MLVFILCVKGTFIIILFVLVVCRYSTDNILAFLKPPELLDFKIIVCVFALFYTTAYTNTKKGIWGYTST